MITVPVSSQNRFFSDTDSIPSYRDPESAEIIGSCFCLKLKMFYLMILSCNTGGLIIILIQKNKCSQQKCRGKQNLEEVFHTPNLQIVFNEYKRGLWLIQEHGQALGIHMKAVHHMGGP